MKRQEDCGKEDWPALVMEYVELAKAGDETAIPIILEWLQDVNWPGADHALEYLSTLGDELVPYVSDVLGGNDEVWQYWLLHCLIKHWPRSRVHAISKNIIQLSMADDFEHVNLAAIEVMIAHHLQDPESLRSRLDQIEVYRSDISDDINKLRALI